MIQKYTYGTPFETDAIVTSIPASEGTPAYGTISTENGFSFTYDMDDNDVVYGLGESNRGINKRGYVYESNCSDQPDVYKRQLLFNYYSTTISKPKTLPANHTNPHTSNNQRTEKKRFPCASPP